MMIRHLNWQSDPLLIDSTPIVQNSWLTANDLLERNPKAIFASRSMQLELFKIMIRKIDFITGERILQSFPYIALDNKWLKIIRKKSLSLAEKAHFYFEGSNNNKTIRQWQKSIIKYIEDQYRLPFPLFRLVDNWEELYQDKEYVRFQSARGEVFQLPLYLNEDIAYLTGVIMGDGHLAEYFINIIDSSKEHVGNLTQTLAKIFNSKTEFFKQSNANAWNVNILGKWLVRFFNFLSGQPINARKYPALCEPLVFQENVHFRKAFWRGLMDADGSYTKVIGFGTASKRLLSDFSNYLTLNNIHFRPYTQTVFGGTTYSFTIAGESRKDFAKLIGTFHPKKNNELQLLLKKKVNRFSPRISTLEKRGFWKNQVIAFNKNKMLDQYFNFRLIPDLR
ncbi:MAG: LAGLIDADG family homing endonuclease, partial [Candidatus Heimdallarchaeota archaeon]